MNKTVVKTHTHPEIGKAVFAATEIGYGETVIQSRQIRTLPERTKYSLELNGSHILIDEPGVLVNHCCSPNCVLIENNHCGFDFIAIKDISKNEEITFDYESIESEISAFQNCSCGSAGCRKKMNCRAPRGEGLDSGTTNWRHPSDLTQTTLFALRTAHHFRAAFLPTYQLGVLPIY